MRNLVHLVLALLFVGSAYGRVSPYAVKDSGVCNTCLLSVRVVDDFLCDPAATDFLVKFVEKQICPSVSDKNQCYNLAEGLVPTFVDWFRSAASPASLCSSFDVCGSDILSVKHLNQAPLRVKDSSGCGMCEFVVSQLKFAFNTSNAIGEIEKDGVKACQSLPPLLAKPCVEFVVQNADIISRFINSVTPLQLCGLVGVCPASLAASFRPLPLPAALFTAAKRRVGASNNGAQAPTLATAMIGLKNEELRVAAAVGSALESTQICNFCEMAVVEAKAILSSPSFQMQVLNYTKSLCGQMPDYEAICDFYAEQYVPILFTLLQQYLIPDALCGEVGLCPTAGLFMGGSGNSLVRSFVQRFADVFSRGTHRPSVFNQ